MSKRGQETQGGEDRYGAYGGSSGGDMSDKPQKATAAQLAKRTIAQARKPSSNRSSRATTPTANPFAAQQSQQTMNLQPPPQQAGTGFGGDFNFTSNASANPFANMNGTSSSTPPPVVFGGSSAQPNGGGGGGMFGNTNTSFGSTFNSQPQQNGFNPSTSSMFGNNTNSNSNGANQTTSFGGFGNNTPHQPQQNGLSPSTNGSFPSFGKLKGDNVFKGFGQSQQQQTQSTPSTSFGGFGQDSQQNGQRTPSFGGFGGQKDTQTQPNGEKPSMFASTSQAEQTSRPSSSSLFSFGQQNQQDGNKPLFGSTSTSQAEQPPRSGTPSNIFGGQQNGGQKTGLFGSTPPPESRSSTPNLGESVFSGLNKKSVSEGMFTQNKDQQTPKPSTSNVFSGFGQQTAEKGGQGSSVGEQTPKLGGNLFSNLNNESQTNGIKPGLFGTTSKSTSQPDQQQTPKASSSSVFGGAFGGGQQASASQQSNKSLFNFGQSQQSQSDTSMTTPDNTPQKQNESAQPPATSAPEQPAGSPPKETPAGQGGDLFSRIGPRDPPATALKATGFTPSTTSLFSQPAASSTSTSGTGNVNKENEGPAAQQQSGGGSLEDRITPHEPPTTAVKPTSSFTPSQPSAAPWLSHTPAASSALAATTAPAPQQPPASPAKPTATMATAKTTMNETISESEKNTFKVLNEGLAAHLAKQDPNQDWTTIMRYYMQQAAKIRNKPEPKFDAPTITATAPSASSAPSSSAPSTKPAAPAAQPQSSRTQSQGPAASTGNMFGSTTEQQTPRPSGASSLLKPPQTAPVNKNKRPAPEDVEQTPATEKRPRSNAPTEYPKLPENASDTAKLFQATLNKPSGTTSASSKSAEEAKQKEAHEKAEKERKEAEEKERQKQKEKDTSTSTGFKPSAPAAPSGMPTFSAPSTGSGNFLAAFGKKANAEEEKARKKRKMEDYDSDEETEEDWAARDKEEQEAKRQKIMADAKKPSGFMPSATPSAAASDAGYESSGPAGSEKDKETEIGKGGSLFDRITPRDSPAPPTMPGLFAGGAPSTAKKTTSGLSGAQPPQMGSNIFGHLSKPGSSQSLENKDDESDKAGPEKEQDSGDNTWKPNTPIKFGQSTSAGTESTTPAAPPPSFSNLFGTSNTPKPTSDSTGHLNIPGAKPSIGFNFGGQPSSLGTSRATTPGVTTDGEGASTAGEDDDQEEEEQVEDQTGLRPEEKEAEDVLFQIPMAKVMKWADKKDSDSGEMALGWVDKGKGPLYILKHKETGKARILLKVPPYGNAKMNFAPLKDTRYEILGKAGKMVQGIFVDHFDAKNPGKLSKWLVQVGKAEDASEIERVLNEEKPTA